VFFLLTFRAGCRILESSSSGEELEDSGPWFTLLLIVLIAENLLFAAHWSHDMELRLLEENEEDRVEEIHLLEKSEKERVEEIRQVGAELFVCREMVDVKSLLLRECATSHDTLDEQLTVCSKKVSEMQTGRVVPMTIFKQVIKDITECKTQFERASQVLDRCQRESLREELQLTDGALKDDN